MNLSIANPGFEQITLADNDYAARNVPGWQIYDPSNLFANQGSNYSTLNPATISFPNQATEGGNTLGLYMENPVGSGIAGLSQTLNQVLSAETTYTLNVDVGDPLPDEFTGEGFPGYSIQLLAGGQLIAQDYNTQAIAPGSFISSTLRYTASANDPYLRQPLEIRLLNPLLGTGKEVNFDNVQLYETKLPPKLFDRAYYLQNNPDVAAAVSAGQFISELQHYHIHGIREGRTSITPYFNEVSYLQKYQDVAAAVSAGNFSSGLHHFINHGYDEGRSPDVGVPGSEGIYLGKYPDVAQAMTVGMFKSWYDHFLQSGLVEDRSPTYFDPNDYRLFYADAVAAIEDPNDNIVSAFDHFVRIGQFEERLPIFSGTAGNDTIQGFGNKPYLFGTDFEIASASPPDYAFLSKGVGEIDTLIGSPGRELFELGIGTTPSNPTPTQFYVGGGASDYAIIRNFERGIDAIEIANANFTQQVVGGNLNISVGGDLVAIVEGITTTLTPTTAPDFFPAPGTTLIN